jgi:hypothetical protein
MKKRNAKATSRRKATKTENDTALIRECVIYAQSIAAHRAGFRADPDPDCCHAEALGNPHFSRAHQALTKIAGIPTTTPQELRSKARIVPVLFEDNQDGRLNSIGVDFLTSFANEVEKFLEKFESVAEATPTVPAR